MTIIKRLDC